jgi:SAM-dependent methyltransferase
MTAAAAPREYILGYDAAVVDKLSQRRATREGSFLLPHVRPGQSLLDVGCGPGSITLDFARLLSPGLVTGIDLDAGQVAAAEAEAQRSAVRNARFVAADVGALPFADGSFDVVFCHTVFMHLSNPEAAMRELFRVCKPGGLIGVREGLGSFDHLGSVPGDGRPRTFSEFMRELTHLGGGRPHIGVELKGLLHTAGFRDIKPGTYDEIYHEPADLLLLQGWFQSMLEGTLGERAVAGGLITPAGLVELLRAMRHWAADPAAISVVSWIEYVAWRPAHSAQ